MAEIFHREFGRAGGSAADPWLPVSMPPTQAAPARVCLLFTSTDETLGALPVARRLAEALRSRLTLVHFRPVPIGAPLEAPTGLSPAEMEAFRTRVGEEAGDIEIRVYVCRDVRQALRSAIDRRSLIVVGGRHHWWPTRSHRWRRTLEEEGYAVVFVSGAMEERRSMDDSREGRRA